MNPVVCDDEKIDTVSPRSAVHTVKSLGLTEIGKLLHHIREQVNKSDEAGIINKIDVKPPSFVIRKGSSPLNETVDCSAYILSLFSLLQECLDRQIDSIMQSGSAAFLHKDIASVKHAGADLFSTLSFGKQLDALETMWIRQEILNGCILDYDTPPMPTSHKSSATKYLEDLANELVATLDRLLESLFVKGSQAFIQGDLTNVERAHDGAIAVMEFRYRFIGAREEYLQASCLDQTTSIKRYCH